MSGSISNGIHFFQLKNRIHINEWFSKDLKVSMENIAKNFNYTVLTNAQKRNVGQSRKMHSSG